MKSRIVITLLCLIVCLSFVSCVNTANDELPKKTVDEIINDADSKDVVNPEGNLIELSAEDVENKFADATLLLQNSGAMGGGSYLFNREYEDETYNIAYLGRIYRGEISILPEGALDQWVNDVFLNQSEEKQNQLPTIYQAIKGLNISKDDLIALNESRKQFGTEMILSDKYIEALYMSEAEMKKELVNPVALYYEGEIFTWEELNNESKLNSTAKAIPTSVMNEYIDRVITYCGEHDFITDSEVERFFSSSSAIK